ncbi:MAG: hypothetical protein B7X04_00885 [Parcubacteria group bacterium 21-54-25]|nr:MAG: hypothetical protein B7X04_00885 [Parcubacteria group bacterium 21-54-25]HQU07786.1 serine protease [Candidatus Paceibacterota bacterium]
MTLAARCVGFRTCIFSLLTITTLFAYGVLPAEAATRTGHPSFLQSMEAAALGAVSPSTTPQGSGSGQVMTPLDANSSGHDDIVALTRPTIVRVLVHFVGTTTVPAFKVNLEKLSWSVGATSGSQTMQIPYELYETGTGFVVNPNGYILTDAHVVSPAELQKVIAGAALLKVMASVEAGMTAKENAYLNRIHTQAQYEQLGIDGVAFILDHISMPNASKVVVLSPGKTIHATSTGAIASSALLTQIQNSNSNAVKAQVASLMQSGISATIVSVNNNFLNDEKDVALLHVPETNLPALTIGSSRAVQTGDPIYVFGYPANADFGGLNDEPVFTSGVIDAQKPSTLNTFNYLETDAKVSPGSSGSPVINANGNAIGMLTLGISNASGGDSFSLATPISLASAVLADHSIATSTPGSYAAHVRAGIALKNAQHCKAAITEFQAAESKNNVFGDSSKYLDPYITACNALIASGRSLDTPWDYVRNWVFNQDSFFWVLLVIGVLAVTAASSTLLFLVRRNKSEEQTIDVLKSELGHLEQIGAATSAGIAQTVSHPAATAAASPHDPALDLLTGYIRNARAADQTDEVIRAALATAGWKSEEIEAGFLALGR